MAWNPTPTVAAARDFGKKFRKQQVIIVSIDMIGGTIQMDSYGETKTLCDEAQTLGNAAYDAVYKSFLAKGDK